MGECRNTSPIPEPTGCRHTETNYFNKFVESRATQILGPFNRAVELHINIEDDSPPVWIGDMPDLIAGNGRWVNVWKGLDYRLGPGKLLYAFTLGPFGAVIYGTIEDSVDEGRFTDHGSGVEDARCGGGDTAQGDTEDPDSTD